MKRKVAIVSGGSRGIGRAIVLELARGGMDVAFNFSQNKDAALRTEEEAMAFGVKAKTSQVDIRDFSAVHEWVNKVKESFGGLDVIVNNAGIINDKALMMMVKEDWQNVIDTNLGGTFNLAHAGIIGFMKQGSGSVVNITSVSGVIGMPKQTNYSASKAGIIGFTKSLAKEVAKFNVRVNAVAPGFIETDMVKGLRDEYKAKVVEQIPLKRLGKAEEVAKVVSFLVSEAARYITGQTIIIDGGLSLQNG